MCVSKSTDCCSTWTISELTTTYGCTNTLALDPVNTDIVYAGGYDGVFKTTDGGTTWTLMSDTLLLDVMDIAVHPVDTDIVLAVSRDGVYKSTDAGNGWEYIGSSLVNGVIIDNMNPDQVYIATDSSVYQGTLDGNWTIMNQGLDDVPITSIAINPDNYLFCGTDGSAVFRWDLGSGVEEYTQSSMSRFQVFPNPARRTINILYHLQYESTVSVTVYDVQGRLIDTLYKNRQTPGMHSVVWNGRDMRGTMVSPGVYFCRLTKGKETAVQKIILVR